MPPECYDVEMYQALQPESPRRRPSRTLRGWLIRLGVVLPAVLLAGWLIGQNIDRQAWQRKLENWLKPAESAPADLAFRPGTNASAAAASLSASAADVLKQVEPSVVLIEADGPGGLSVIGAGFVVGEAGQIATSFHVASEATAGVARFRSGAVY